MTVTGHADRLKAVLAPFAAAAKDFAEAPVRAAVDKAIAPDALVRMCHPVGDLTGGQAWYDEVYAPLLTAMPDLERRDLIVLAGTTPEGQDWIGTMGNYMGTFLAPFMEIPPTGHLAHMRYHEFFKVEAGWITEVNAIWDLPELMMQARAWPMAPQLGAYLCTPSPGSGDGLSASGDGSASLEHIKRMETAMCRHPEDPDPRVMRLSEFWHPRFNWYGPAGIGTGRGISGFRHWHQIPFLRGMPDRKADPTGDRLASEEMADLMSHWISVGNYVCETGWPNMRMKLTHDGWMGIAPLGREITLRSVDFWRLEDGRIRENWVQIDVLYVYSQLGVDVFARMREFNKARNMGPVPIDGGLS
jgi:predicted ester cyclase